MQRAKAILLVLAMLASPLALLARAANTGTPECGRMCCLPHGGHASRIHHAGQQAQSGEMPCHHGEPSHMLECSMNAGAHQFDYGFIAPIVPTAPSSVARLAIPETNRQALAQLDVAPASGFLAAPFQPPRN